MRLIDADKYMNELNEAQIEFDDYYKGIGRAKSILLDQPTVEERQHGHWIETNWGKYIRQCSNCDYIKRRQNLRQTFPNFCENCGAIMDEVHNGI